ncbi:MAG: ComEA family DNA-binding protein, partial [Caldilineaceae bacterium]
MATHDEPPAIVPARSQPLIAGGVVLGLAGLAGWFIAAGGLQGELVHYDHPPAVTAVFTIDINEASVAEFSQLPGLGKVTAQKIVDHRKAKGAFVSHDDLLAVPGIGQVTL